MTRMIEFPELADCFRGLDEFRRFARLNDVVLARRWETERAITSLTRTPGRLPGWSRLIGAPVEYLFEPHEAVMLPPSCRRHP